MTHAVAAPRQPVFSRAFLAAAGLLGVLLVLGAITLFIQLADPMMLVFGLVLLTSIAFVLLARWVYVDANRLGMPGLPWAILVLIVPILGLAGYLVLRELRRQPA